MALFFDADWFDARLASLHLGRGDVAAALSLDAMQIDEMWKDQRELTARNVRVLAGLLGVEAAEVAEHAGISTPMPGETGEGPLERIEAALTEIKSLLRRRKAKNP